MHIELFNDPSMLLTTIALAVGGLSLFTLIFSWLYVWWLRRRKRTLIYPATAALRPNFKAPSLPAERYYAMKPGIDYKNWQGTTHIAALWDASEGALRENFSKQSLTATIALLRTMNPANRLRVLNTLKLHGSIKKQLLQELGM